MDIKVFAHSQIYTDKIETDLDLWRKGRLKKCHSKETVRLRA